MTKVSKGQEPWALFNPVSLFGATLGCQCLTQFLFISKYVNVNVFSRIKNTGRKETLTSIWISKYILCNPVCEELEEDSI